MKELFAPKFGRVGTCFWYFNRGTIGKIIILLVIIWFLIVCLIKEYNEWMKSLDLSFLYFSKKILGSERIYQKRVSLSVC